jgi:TolA-binding protein
MEEEVALKSKILKAIGMSDEAEVLALKSQVTTLEDKIDNMQKDFQEALKSMQEEFTQTLTEALKPVEEVEVAEKSEEAEPEPTEEEVAEVEVEEEVEEEPEADKSEEVVEETVEPVAEKGESKQEPVHDNLKAEKSKPKSVYELMGRYPNGVKIRK